MKIVKLPREEKSNIDAIGWFAIFMYCEREQSYNYFDTDDIETVIDIFTKDQDLYLFKIFDQGKEIGRFGIRGNNHVYCLTGLVIYKPYRNKGYFKRVIDYLLDSYTSLYLYTSNKYIANTLFKDDRFQSIGWEFKQHNDDLEIRFETKNLTLEISNE
jgi:hypothetical protein